MGLGRRNVAHAVVGEARDDRRAERRAFLDRAADVDERLTRQAREREVVADGQRGHEELDVVRFQIADARAGAGQRGDLHPAQRNLVLAPGVEQLHPLDLVGGRLVRRRCFGKWSLGT